VLDALPGETVEYADAVLGHSSLGLALGRLPDAPLVSRRVEWIVSAVRERLHSDDPREEVAEAF
jgi:hypothetical protein